MKFVAKVVGKGTSDIVGPFQAALGDEVYSLC